MGRDLVEDTLRVELGAVLRCARGAAGWVGAVELGGASVSVACSFPTTEGEGAWLVLSWEAGGRAYRRRAPLVSTPQKLGGRRWWALCPLCWRRCAALYVAGGVAGCRSCLGLAYQSQRERGFRRACSAAHKLRERHGGPRSLMTPWLKPPRMRWARWADLQEREAGYLRAVLEGARKRLAPRRRA